VVHDKLEKEGKLEAAKLMEVRDRPAIPSTPAKGGIVLGASFYVTPRRGGKKLKEIRGKNPAQRVGKKKKFRAGIR